MSAISVPMLQAKARSVVRSSMVASMAHNRLLGAKFGLGPRKNYNGLFDRFVGQDVSPRFDGITPSARHIRVSPGTSQRWLSFDSRPAHVRLRCPVAPTYTPSPPAPRSGATRHLTMRRPTRLIAVTTVSDYYVHVKRTGHFRHSRSRWEWRILRRSKQIGIGFMARDSGRKKPRVVTERSR